MIRFGPSALDDALELLRRHGFEHFVLLTTERAAAQARGVAAAAADTALVPHGPVPDAAAAVRPAAGGRPIVALGGGRVIDTAKAVASADGSAVAAIPTTLSGAELNAHHRPVPGFEDAPRRRPALVIADPSLMASLPRQPMAATAMNALAHAVEALYTPEANPVSEAVGLEASRQLARGLHEEDRPALALGGLLAGYALGGSSFAVHHILSQTLVRVAGTPHAQTNAVILPHVVRMMEPRAPREMALLGQALQRPGDPAGAMAELAALSGVTRLRDLGVDEAQLDEVVAAALARADLARTPGPPLTEQDLRRLLRAAL